MSASQSETRLGRLIDTRETIRRKHEDYLAAIEGREDQTLTETDQTQIKKYREQAANIDVEVADLAAEIDAHNKAVDESRRLRRSLAGKDGIEEPDGPVYRDFYTYARDFVLTRDLSGSMQLAAAYSDSSELARMRERLNLLKRTPDNTLSSDVPGLTPAQHIAQIFQVIDTSRPLVASAQRTALNRGQLTYPSVDQRPVVEVQASEKTEAGNQGMVISMKTANASVYLGGGDISWQAANWSSPDAIRLWFDLAAADYALKTERDAAQALQHSAFTNDQISSPIGGTPSFADFMTAIGAGYAEVFANSNRTANTIYMAPDRYGYLLGLTSNAFTQFTNVTGSQVGPLNVVISRGMDAGVIVVGDSAGLLVAETPGAPVELRVTEPAIGGYEVGLIGAFEAVVVDPGAFSMITTAS